MATLPKDNAAMLAIEKLKSKAREWKYETPVATKIALAKACLQRAATLRNADEKWMRGDLTVEGRLDDAAAEKRFLFLIAVVPALRTIVQALEKKYVPKLAWETERHRVYKAGRLAPIFLLQKELWTDPREKRVLGFEDDDDDDGGKNGEKGQGRVCLVLGAGNENGIEMRDAIDRLFLHGDVVLIKRHPVRWFLYECCAYILGPLMDAGVMCHVQDEGVEFAKALVEHPDVGHVHLTGGLPTFNAVRKGLDAAGKAKVELSAELGCVTPWIFLPDMPQKKGRKWSKASVRYYAHQLAGCKGHNGGALCISPQVAVIPANWEFKEDFLRFLRLEIEAHKAHPSYYPGSIERVTAVAESLKSTAKAVDLVRPQFPTDQKTLDKFNAEMKQAGRITQARQYAIPVVHVGEVPSDRSQWAEWTTRYKGVLQEEAFGPLLAIVEMPPSTKDTEDELANYKQSVLDTIDYTNDHLFGSLSASIFAPDTTDKDFVNECVGRLRYGSVTINAWNGVGYAAADGGWGAYPGLYTPEAAGSGNCQVGNPHKIPGLHKTVLRGPFHSTLVDLANSPPGIITDAALRFMCNRDNGILSATLAAIWSMLTWPFRPHVKG